MGVTSVEGDGGGGDAAYINHLRSAFEEMMDPLRERWRLSLVSQTDLMVSKAELSSMIPALVALYRVQVAEGGMKDMRDVRLECLKAAGKHGADVALHPSFKALGGD